MPRVALSFSLSISLMDKVVTNSIWIELHVLNWLGLDQAYEASCIKEGNNHTMRSEEVGAAIKRRHPLFLHGVRSLPYDGVKTPYSGDSLATR